MSIRKSTRIKRSELSKKSKYSINIDKMMLFLISSFIILSVLFLTAKPVFAGEFGNQECYDICESGAFNDELGELCLGYYDDYEEECMSIWGDDYVDQCLEDHPDEGLDEDSCMDEYSWEYVPICFFEDHYEELGEECLSDHWDEMMDECVDLPLVEYGADGCCPNPSDVWVDELQECVDENYLDCFNEGGCSLSGSQEFGDCDGKLGEPVGGSDFCITVDEYDCLDNHGIWVDGNCYDEEEFVSQLCEEEGGFWSEELEECFENEDEKNCLENEGYYSYALDRCFEDEDDLLCSEEGMFFYEGNCLEENAYECAQEGKYYCSATSSCVDDENACCEEEELYVELDGECAESVEEADCRNQGLYWSEELEECFGSEEEAECEAEGKFWSDKYYSCFDIDSEEATNCLENGGFWKDGVCYDNSKEYDCSSQGLHSFQLANGVTICLNDEEYDCYTSNGVYFNGNCVHNPYAYCTSLGMVYSKKDDVCYRSLAEKECVENYKHPSYVSPWVDYLQECFAEEFQGENWDSEFECVGGDSFEPGASIGIWNKELKKCFYGERAKDEEACAMAGGWFDYGAKRNPPKPILFPNDGVDCYPVEFYQAYLACEESGGAFTRSGLCLSNEKLEFTPPKINYSRKEVFDDYQKDMVDDCDLLDDFEKDFEERIFSKKELVPVRNNNFQRADVAKLTPAFTVVNKTFNKTSFYRNYVYLKSKCKKELNENPKLSKESNDKELSDKKNDREPTKEKGPFEKNIGTKTAYDDLCKKIKEELGDEKIIIPDFIPVSNELIQVFDNKENPLVFLSIKDHVVEELSCGGRSDYTYSIMLTHDELNAIIESNDPFKIIKSMIDDGRLKIKAKGFVRNVKLWAAKLLIGFFT